MNDILILLLILFVFFLALRAIRVLPEYERVVVLRLGRYAGTRGPGIAIVIPMIEQASKVDLRERFLEIPRQTAITRDNAPISIDLFVYYRMIDPKLAVLQVTDVIRASLNIATTTLRAVIGDISLDDVLAKREAINDQMRLKLDEITERWGVKIMSVEIREIEPPRDIQEAMNRQMTAERSRRAAVTTASGQRESAIMVAEGQKQSEILRAEGDKQSEILRAEAARFAQEQSALGFAQSLATIHEQAQAVDRNTLLLQYLDTLRSIGGSNSTKIVMPMELTGMMQDVVGAINATSLLPVPTPPAAKPTSNGHQPKN